MRIPELLDPRNPVVSGDLISNPLYNPGGNVEVCLVGEFESFTREQMGWRIRKEGAKVVPMPTPTTTFVLVGKAGDDPAASAENRRALELGIPMLTEEELDPFLE